MTLSEEKTLITHIEQGFDFLGWNFRKHKDTLIIKPSKASQQNIQDKIRNTIRRYRAAKQENLIRKLNSIITGWCNNHRNVAAKKAFSKLDHIVFISLWKWAKRRHPNKSTQWIKDRYWKNGKYRDWIFSSKKITLKFATSTKIIRHPLIKFDANPYLLTDRLYYIDREKQRKKRKYQHAANIIIG
jgi:RNA-directed DNA polymerase